MFLDDGGVHGGWRRRRAEEKGINREQLVRVRNRVMNSSLIVIYLGSGDSRRECRQERLVG